MVWGKLLFFITNLLDFASALIKNWHRKEFQQRLVGKSQHLWFTQNEVCHFVCNSTQTCRWIY